MKIPRDLSGMKLAKSLEVLGYRLTRQSGSHMRLITHENGEHHVTIPKRASLRVGTIAGILSDVAEHFGITRGELIRQLFS